MRIILLKGGGNGADIVETEGGQRSEGMQGHKEASGLYYQHTTLPVITVKDFESNLVAN